MTLARLLVPARLNAWLVAWLCVVNQLRFETPLAIGIAAALTLIPTGRSTRIPCACFAAAAHDQACACDCHDLMPAPQL